MINIIGAGMAGSLMAKILREADVTFKIFDAGLAQSASRIAENLIGVRWYQEDRELLDRAMKILDRLGIKKHKISQGVNMTYQYDRDSLLEPSFIKSEVEVVKDGVMQPVSSVFGNVEPIFHQGFNIICMGVWDKKLVVKPVVGIGVEFHGQTDNEYVRGFMPYRQEKLVNVTSNKYWYSQSLSVAAGTFEKKKKQYMDQLTDRMPEDLKKQHGLLMIGLRPKFPINVPHENVWGDNWVRINGGYKSGLVNYPVQCEDVLKGLKDKNLL